MWTAGRARALAQEVRGLRHGAHRRSVRRRRGDLSLVRPRQRSTRRRLRSLRHDRADEAEVQRRGVPGAGHDVCRSAQGHDPARRLEQGPGDGRQDDSRHQGAGSLFRRHPAHGRPRHVHRERHRTGHREPAAPVAGRVLPRRRQDALRRADHSVSRLVGGVRVRREESALRAHRSKAQVPGDGLPARARSARGGRDSPDVLYGRGAQAQGGRTDRLEGVRLDGRPPFGSGTRDPRLGSVAPCGQENPQGSGRGSEEGRHRGRRARRRRARRRLLGLRRRRPVDGRSDSRGERGAVRARHRDGAREERAGARDLLPGEGRGRVRAVADPEEGSDSEARRGAHRDLPAAAAGRSADARQFAQPLREHVLQRAEVRASRAWAV